ncbi:hypothetical protein GIB67_020657 [Kingdonia uniflora]|uniref:Uncharacterized protein n=1 Tax=Kingdonia uniflora TaxID=39325 RepID=A0A7J7M980_9MAGN|nr:hypothetical protein GIB67_020657 [Kingdonia uniflora]
MDQSWEEYNKHVDKHYTLQNYAKRNESMTKKRWRQTHIDEFYMKEVEIKSDAVDDVNYVVHRCLYHDRVVTMLEII